MLTAANIAAHSAMYIAADMYSAASSAYSSAGIANIAIEPNMASITDIPLFTAAVSFIQSNLWNFRFSATPKYAVNTMNATASRAAAMQSSAFASKIMPIAAVQSTAAGAVIIMCMAALARSTVPPRMGIVCITQRLLPSSDMLGADMNTMLTSAHTISPTSTPA